MKEMRAYVDVKTGRVQRMVTLSVECTDEEAIGIEKRLADAAEYLIDDGTGIAKGQLIHTRLIEKQRRCVA